MGPFERSHSAFVLTRESGCTWENGSMSDNRNTGGNQGIPKSKSPMDRRGLRDELRSLDKKNTGWLAITFLLAVVISLAPWGLQIMGFQLGKPLGQTVFVISGILLLIALVMAFRLNKKIGLYISVVSAVLIVIGYRTV